MISDRHPLFSTYKWIKRVTIAVVGFTVLTIGIAMLVLPGPAVIVIPAGLGILAVEFAWAKRLLVRAKERGAGFIRSPPWRRNRHNNDERYSPMGKSKMRSRT
jgi:tellurite resistance protein TerC